MQKLWKIHDFLDLHDDFHFLIGFLEFLLQNVSDSVVFSIKYCISVLPAFSGVPSSTMEGLGPKLRKNDLPWGVGYGEDKKAKTACTREKHGFLMKMIILSGNASFVRILKFHN